MPPECQVICSLALTKFTYICESLKSGEITLGELRNIAENTDQMNRLCEAVTIKGDTTMSTILKQRLAEYREFEDHKKLYLIICNWIPARHCFDGRSMQVNVLYLRKKWY